MILKGVFGKNSLKITILPPDLVRKCNLMAKIDINCNISSSYLNLFKNERQKDAKKILKNEVCKYLQPNKVAWSIDSITPFGKELLNVVRDFMCYLVYLLKSDISVDLTHQKNTGINRNL